MHHFRVLVTIKRYYGKKHSSNMWLERQSRDPYVKKAREEDWRCRSAFKLLEIDAKHKLLKPGQLVIDCGCAPGSWTQVIVQKINSNSCDMKLPKGTAIGIDLQYVNPIRGAILLSKCDFTSAKTQAEILQNMGNKKADLVLSDMAPACTGDRSMDHHKIIELCSSVIRFSTVVLKKDGSVLCKLWMGGQQKLLEDAMRKLFLNVKPVKPNASRDDSAEIYLLGRNFKGMI
ncbi:rRNA methyltransferase 2, mitochondrial-like [Mytilus galloprovincialis]|uniref:rRNA methyltransferase 2, mitochondrial-like n=1 Tax=Mytilus galloprovincialis TaxID=29158 RepID=UPI003F7B4E4F